MSKKKFQFTHVSACMKLILSLEDTTSISISGPLSKERRIAFPHEPGNGQNCNAFAVIYKDRVVGYIPWAISKCISLFLTLPRPFLETRVTVKRINRGGGYGLEVPCKYHISGQEKAVD